MMASLEDKQNINGKLKIYESVPFGILLAVVGGLLDAYTYIGRHGVFANAQTGNMVLLGIHASNGEWRKALLYAPPILAFILGVIVVEIVKKVSPRFFQLDWVQMTLLLEVIALFLIGLIPADFPDIVVTVVISFVASVQVSSFSRLVDSAYATTMMTGNLRSFSHTAYRAIVNKDNESGKRAVRYIIIIFSFLIGAVVGGLLTKLTGTKAIWLADLILLVCTVVTWSTGNENTSIR